LGFDKIRPIGVEYFRGIREALERAGNDVHLVRLPPFAGVEARARALVEAIERIEAPRVNIIAHSMGGLDARYALSRLGIADRVASLITVGTPHRGTPLADWPGYDEIVRRWLFAFGLRPLVELGTHSAEQFNREVPDATDVFYGSVLGAVRTSFRERSALAPLHRWVAARAGDNDVLVPVSSQLWGEVISEIDADHWAQVGWSTAFDARRFYKGLANDLRARGL
jgi:triacylglycerol lipase